MNEKKPGKRLKFYLILFLTSFGITIIFQIGQAILKINNMKYRNWLEVIGTLMTIFVTPILFGIVFTQACEKRKSEKQPMGFPFFWAGEVLILTLVALYMLIMSFVLLVSNQSIFETEQIQPGINKKLQLERETFDKNIKDTKRENIRKNKLAEKESEIEIVNTQDNTTPENTYQILYDTIFKEKGDIYKCTYNAKGNFYAILGTDREIWKGKETDTRRTVVYDRESKNGKCQLFVAYKEYCSEDGNIDDTEILNFYAVDMESGKVLIADKSSWSEVGSEEYRKATGE